MLKNFSIEVFLGAKLCLIGSMANGLATSLSDMDLVLILNDTYIEPQHVSSSSNNSGESMNIDENSCSNDVDMNRNKVKQMKRISRIKSRLLVRNKRQNRISYLRNDYSIKIEQLC